MVEVVPDMTVGVLKEQLKTFPADSLETFFFKVDSRENEKANSFQAFFLVKNRAHFDGLFLLLARKKSSGDGQSEKNIPSQFRHW